MNALLIISQLMVGAPAVAIGVTGTVEIETKGGRELLARFQEVPESATVITAASSSAKLRFASGSVVRLGANTEVVLGKLKHNVPVARRKESLKLKVGRVWAKVTSLFGDDSEFDVTTSNAVCGVRGTTFVVETTPQQVDRVVVVEGAVEVVRDAVRTTLDGSGAFVNVGADGIGKPGRLSLSEVDAVQKGAGGVVTLVTKLGKLAGVPAVTAGPVGAARDATRSDLLGPSALSDTGGAAPDVSGDLAPGTTVDPAEIEVRLQFPDAAP